jgi:chorismate synthase
MSNSLGELLRITSFGESHGRCIGVVIDGCPAGLSLSTDDIQRDLDRRKPRAGSGQTARSEEDKVEILAGVFNGCTTGAPICLIVENKDISSTEYEKIRFTPRPGHADYTAYIKYGGFNDYRGGGRFSGRITAGLVMAGAVAKKVLMAKGIEILAHVVEIGGIKASPVAINDIREKVYSSPLRCTDFAAESAMLQVIRQAGTAGDSLGGIIEGIALNVPAGLGEPLFGTVEGELSKALFAIPAVKGVEFGSGFSAAVKKGSENNDQFVIRDKRVETLTNNAGGVLGGITNGMPIVVRVAVKPTPSIAKNQKTINMQKMENTDITVQGRHDVCIVPRAVPVVESLMAVTLTDLALRAGLIMGVLK